MSSTTTSQHLPAHTQNKHPKPPHQLQYNYSLIDLRPPTPPHLPQPPSPLLTAASNSPPFFPFARTPSDSSFSDLSLTVKPLPEPSHASPPSTTAAPTAPPPPTPAHRPPPTPTSTHHDRKLHDRFLELGGTAYHQPVPPHPLPHPPFPTLLDRSPIKTKPLYSNSDIEVNEELLNGLPAGFPYQDWRGWGLLALEWLWSMQGFLLGALERDCRWGGARHTV